MARMQALMAAIIRLDDAVKAMSCGRGAAAIVLPTELERMVMAEAEQRIGWSYQNGVLTLCGIKVQFD